MLTPLLKNVIICVNQSHASRIIVFAKSATFEGKGYFAAVGRFSHLTFLLNIIFSHIMTNTTFTNQN